MKYLLPIIIASLAAAAADAQELKFWQKWCQIKMTGAGQSRALDIDITDFNLELADIQDGDTHDRMQLWTFNGSHGEDWRIDWANCTPPGASKDEDDHAMNYYTMTDPDGVYKLGTGSFVASSIKAWSTGILREQFWIIDIFDEATTEGAYLQTAGVDACDFGIYTDITDWANVRWTYHAYNDQDNNILQTRVKVTLWNVYGVTYTYYSPPVSWVDGSAGYVTKGLNIAEADLDGDDKVVDLLFAHVELQSRESTSGGWSINGTKTLTMP